MQANAQNGEAGAAGQKSMTRQHRGEQETAKEGSVRGLGAKHYLRIHAGADPAAELKGGDGIPDGGRAIKIDDAACKCAKKDAISIIR